MTLLLDTQALIWLAAGNTRLSRRVRDRISRSRIGEVQTSVLSFWEFGRAIERGRAKIRMPLSAARRELLAAGISELPVSSEIVLDALGLDNLPDDPMDRLIVATARVHGATLVTADESILAWAGEVERLDARE